MASAEKYAEWIVSNQDKRGTPEFETVAQAYKLAKTPVAAPNKPLTNDNPNPIDQFILDKFGNALAKAPDIQGSVPGRFIQGAADLPVGAVQLAANAVGLGDSVNARISEISKRTEALRGPDAGFDFARLAGNISNPVLFGAARAIPAAGSYMGRVGQGVGAGAGAGLTAPVTTDGDFATEKAIQAGSGAALGGALPAAAPLVVAPAKAAYHGLIEPWMNPAAIKGRAFLEAAGDKADEIIALLRGNKQIVPGSAPTAGEAATEAGRAEFAALQRSASNVAPSDYLARADAQNAARLAAVRSVGQTPEALAAAESARSAAAKINYGEAYKQAVKADPKLIALSDNPYFKDALPDALKLAEANGINPKSGLTQFLHYVKISLDKQLRRTGDAALDNTEKAAVSRLQKELVGWMGGKNKPYEDARAAFAEASRPINQMQVGQYLEGKLAPALSDEAKQKAAAYSQALRDAPGTIKRATGSPRFDELTQALTPEQVAVVNSVRDDLARGARFDVMAQRGSKSGPNAIELASQSMEREVGGKVPNILHRGAMLANAIITRLEGKIDKKLASEMAAEMLNPPTVAESMVAARAREAKNAALSRYIQNYKIPVIGGSIQSAAGEQ